MKLRSHKNSHIGHCTHSMENVIVNVQIIFHRQNNITFSTNCKYRPCFVYIIVINLHKGDIDDDTTTTTTTSSTTITTINNNNILASFHDTILEVCRPTFTQSRPIRVIYNVWIQVASYPHLSYHKLNSSVNIPHKFALFNN